MIIIMSKLVLHITEFNGRFQSAPLVIFKFYARIIYEHLAHYLQENLWLTDSQGTIEKCPL